MTNSFYNHDDGYPAFGAQGASAAMRAQFDKIQAGFDKMPTLTGNGDKLIRINAAGTALEAFTTFTDTTTYNVSTSAHGLMSKLPGGTSTFYRADGTFAATPAASVVQSDRTSNTIFASADISTLINYTSGTFTQTFTAAATLGNGWFIYVRNSGTGTITLDPNGGETIDGAATLALNPREVRMIICNGTAFTTIPIANIGGLVLLTPPFVTPTAAASVDFLTTCSSVYDNYRVFLDGIRPNVTDSLILRFAVAGAADTTSNYYNTLPSGATNTTATASFTIGPTVLQAAGGFSGVIDIMNVNDSVRGKQFSSCSAHQVSAAPGFNSNQQNGHFNKANVVTGFQFAWLSGNNFEAVGRIRVYGYQSS